MICSNQATCKLQEAINQNCEGCHAQTLNAPCTDKTCIFYPFSPYKDKHKKGGPGVQIQENDLIMGSSFSTTHPIVKEVSP